MIRAVRRFFEVDRHGTTLAREAVAGVTTFVTMAYIIVINPKILEAAGMPFGPAMAATILTAAFGTLAMGLYAKRPYAIAPYMGENAFIAFTVVRVLGYSWQTDLPCRASVHSSHPVQDPDLARRRHSAFVEGDLRSG